MRRALPLAFLFALAACARQTAGPVAPIAQAQVTPAPALDASAARQTVVDFVEAYGASPEQGVGPIARLVAGEDLASWVRWLDVQNREFNGKISATSDVRDVEFVGALAGKRATGAQVALSASVTFTYDPVGDDPIELARVLDGPVTLVRTAPGSYLVLDLIRNGVPMSDAIWPFNDELRAEGGLSVRMDSLFMFPPNWQFNVVVENHGGNDLSLDPAGSALFVDNGKAFERVDGVTTSSLGLVPAGSTVEGLMVFPAQDSATGRVLSLVYGTGRDRRRFEFPLEDLVTAVPPPPPTAEGSPAASPG